MVAGTGSDQNLPGSQVEMVAGPRSNLNLQTQKGRPPGAAGLREFASQVEMVAGARNHRFGATLSNRRHIFTGTTARGGLIFVDIMTVRHPM